MSTPADRRPDRRRDRKPGPRGPRGGSAAIDRYVVPGERAVRELLEAAPERIRRLLIERNRGFEDLEASAETFGIPIERLDGEVLRERLPDVDTRGVVAVADPPPEVELDDLLGEVDPSARRLLVALDGVVDPQNLGAIMRSCEFFGVAGLIWPRDRAAGLGPAVVRASAGASERLPLCRVTNLATALADCKDAGLWVVGTVPEGGEPLPTLCRDDRLPSGLVLVMGSEHKGLRRLTAERCDFLATIEGRGGVASLNVSAAAAIALSWLSART